MILYLLRHGEAEPYGHTSDESRALVPAGVRAVAQVGEALESVDAVYCSPYLRARQTADRVLHKTGQSTYKLSKKLTPDRSVSELLEWLGTLGHERLLLVGHNPLLSALANQVAGQPSAVALAPASLACLDVVDWYAGGADLLWIR